MNDVDVTYRGPVFDGRAQAMTDRAVREMEHHLGSVGADYVRGELERVLRKETPEYRLRITSTEYPSRSVINDDGSVKGPWLEGTSSRNRTTRFKGYSTFRRMTQKLNAEAGRILAPYVDRLVDRINHGA
jgi:hypothetical protein